MATARRPARPGHPLVRHRGSPSLAARHRGCDAVRRDRFLSWRSSDASLTAVPAARLAAGDRLAPQGSLDFLPLPHARASRRAAGAFRPAAGAGRDRHCRAMHIASARFPLALARWCRTRCAVAPASPPCRVGHTCPCSRACSSSPKPRPWRSALLSIRAGSSPPRLNCADISPASPTPHRRGNASGRLPAGNRCVGRLGRPCDRASCRGRSDAPRVPRSVGD